MYLIENYNKQTENNEQIINDELNKNIIKEIKEENTIEELSSEKNRNEENFNTVLMKMKQKVRKIKKKRMLMRKMRIIL